MKSKYLLMMGCLVLVFAGSACVHTGFTATAGLQSKARADDCFIDVVLDGRPDRPYQVIGRITTTSSMPGIFALGENEEIALARMKREACRVGAHVIFNIGTDSQGHWGYRHYSRSTRGGATVAVYVSPSDGQVLNPPLGFRIVDRRRPLPAPVELVDKANETTPAQHESSDIPLPPPEIDSGMSYYQ